MKQYLTHFTHCVIHRVDALHLISFLMAGCMLFIFVWTFFPTVDLQDPMSLRFLCLALSCLLGAFGLYRLAHHQQDLVKLFFVLLLGAVGALLMLIYIVLLFAPHCLWCK